MNDEARTLGRRIIAHHSKSFSLASRLLPADARDRAVVVYAWCRRADDAVDLAPEGTAEAALAKLQRELDAIYAGRSLDDPILQAFQHVTQARRIPRHYPQELLDGLAMDATGTIYDGLPLLLRYCYRVAGVVGLMMCHVLGVRHESATRNATHLGVAMQLTNICRDVEEDWRRGRLYLPDDLLQRHDCGGLSAALRSGTREPLQVSRAAVAHVVADLLDIADGYYASGNEGIPALSWRCGLAVRTASKVYAAIGDRIRGRECDPLAGRAWVDGRGKLRLVLAAAAGSLGQAMQGTRRAGNHSGPLQVPENIVLAEDVLPCDLGAETAFSIQDTEQRSLHTGARRT